MIADLHNILKPFLVEDNGLVGSMSSDEHKSGMGATMQYSVGLVDSSNLDASHVEPELR